jgi:hypothetical protein
MIKGKKKPRLWRGFAHLLAFDKRQLSSRLMGIVKKEKEYGKGVGTHINKTQV